MSSVFLGGFLNGKPDVVIILSRQISDWDRYAAEEYELLVAEEGGPDHSDDM